jgi:hypothetical protein
MDARNRSCALFCLIRLGICPVIIFEIKGLIKKLHPCFDHTVLAYRKIQGLQSPAR